MTETGNPYVGLRPFDVEESILFFGRNDQTLELLQRLHQHHFVAVVGNSGCGKSSLLRAGLIPALIAGFLIDTSDHWIITIMKPGQSPLYNLANTLLHQVDPGADATATELFFKKLQEEGAGALLELIAPMRKAKNCNFFLLVDQFEELFRFAIEQNDVAKKEEAFDFVNIILELSNQQEIPFYVVTTMRSDFIGDCAQFSGLPEAMNKSQYLVPRLNRQQLTIVIEGPARLYKCPTNPALTSRLINDLGKVKDELPLLQHALMRVWDYEKNTDKNNELDLNDYEKIGGIEKALSIHADDAIVGMNETELLIIKKMFQALTIVDERGRKIRRPVLLSELKELTGAGEAEILKLIQHFISDERSFLIISDAGALNDKIIDISHESLIRQWDTLNNWVDEDAESVSNFKRLSESAALFMKRKKDLLIGKELQIALNWYDSFQPGETWAKRYSTDFKRTFQYLEKSRERQKQEQEKIKRRKFIKKFLIIGSALMILFIIAAIVFFVNRFNENERDRNKKMNDEINFRIKKEEARKTDSTNLAKFIEMMYIARSKENKLQAFLFTIKALELEQDPIKRDSLIATNLELIPAYTLETILPLNSGAYWSAFGPENKTIYTWAMDSTLTEWDLKTGNIIRTKSIKSKFYFVTDTISIFIIRYKIPFFENQDVRSNNITNSIILDSSNYFNKMFLNFFGKTQTGYQNLPQIIKKTNGAYYSNNRQMKINWGDNNESIYRAVDLWDRDGLNLGPSLIHDGITGAVISSDNRLILSWGIDSTVRVWKNNHDNSIYRLPTDLMKIKTKLITGVEISPYDNGIKSIDPRSIDSLKKVYQKLNQ